jgi:FKBP-type peptidyl-prolyl cis-trans isomerase
MSSRIGKSAEAKGNEAIDITGDGGLMKKITVDGKAGEEVPSNVQAVVHYTGRLLDGTVFDSSVKRGQPFTFNLGRREVILGWDKGVATMKKGEKCILTCKPDYAYGSRGTGPIPGNATLEFEVELLGWKEHGNFFSTMNVLTITVVIFVLGTIAYYSILPMFM